MLSIIPDFKAYKEEFSYDLEDFNNCAQEISSTLETVCELNFLGDPP